jgi:hypothetical protein
MSGSPPNTLSIYLFLLTTKKEKKREREWKKRGDLGGLNSQLQEMCI